MRVFHCFLFVCFFSEFFSINRDYAFFRLYFIAKINLIFRKYFFGSYASKSECSRFEQRAVIRFWVGEKCKLCEIYGRVSLFHSKPESKRQFMEWKQWFCGTKCSGLSSQLCWQSSRAMKGPITINFCEKWATVNSASYYQLLRQIFSNLSNDSFCYIYGYLTLIRQRRKITSLWAYKPYFGLTWWSRQEIGPTYCVW